jgi:hypothetical protein
MALNKRVVGWSILATLGVISVLAAIAILLPLYGVWVAEQDGRAILARAESSKKAQVADAEAKFQSAKYLKQAADEIQNGLSPEYLEYLRIQMMEEVGSKNDRAVYFTGQPPAIAPVVSVR